MRNELKKSLPSLRICITFSIVFDHSRFACFQLLMHMVHEFFSPSFLLVLYVNNQAQATLIHLLELQIERRKQAIEDIKMYLLNILLFLFKSQSMSWWMNDDSFISVSSQEKKRSSENAQGSHGDA